jgi:hypothetical protein
MTKDIGFFIPKLSNIQQHDIVLKTVKEFIDNHPYNQYVLFNSFYDKIEIYNIPILHLSHANLFYGDLFVFDFVSLVLASRFPNISKLYYYASNCPWVGATSSNYENWQKILQLEHLNIISSNEYIDDIYNICWKKPVGISEQFNYEELSKII